MRRVEITNDTEYKVRSIIVTVIQHSRDDFLFNTEPPLLFMFACRQETFADFVTCTMDKKQSQVACRPP
jgi:hypothetical protein